MGSIAYKQKKGAYGTDITQSRATIFRYFFLKKKKFLQKLYSVIRVRDGKLNLVHEFTLRA